eukprot:13938260-Ditylum_brightwellii.AAC.1
MPERYINQKVQRIVSIGEEDIKLLKADGNEIEVGFGFVMFADLNSCITIVKRRKLDSVIKCFTLDPSSILVTMKMAEVRERFRKCKVTKSSFFQVHPVQKGALQWCTQFHCPKLWQSH